MKPTYQLLLRFCVAMGSLMALGAGLSVLAQSQPSVSFIGYEEAAPVIRSLAEILPPALRGQTPAELSRAWDAWARDQDAQIRGRLLQGDEDTLVNFLLLGTSFTRQPRIAGDDLAQFKQSGAAASVNTRGQALARAVITPGNNERLLFARKILLQKGLKITSKNQPVIEKYFLQSLARVLAEQESYGRILEAARVSGNPSREFAERSKIYSARGLSLDTSLRPNFAVAQTLSAMLQQGKLSAGQIQRIAIIGPGLDFADKQDGYDFYPQQTLQPFAVMDVLLRLGLAQRENLVVTTFDLSPRVNDHLLRAKQRARAGYTIQLPLDTRTNWQPALLDYWQNFGAQVGATVKPLTPPPSLSDLRLRAVKVRPDLLKRLAVRDTNIVLQRVELPLAERFDLVIATNILVYYDNFFQSLALLNIEKMLRPGGFLLSNNALLELPSTPIRSVGYTAVPYSDAPNDGDFVVWYQRAQ